MGPNATISATDVCQSNWSPVATAAGWVSFTGAIAAFIFAGITFLLAATPTRPDAAARGFKLLLTAFFAFITLAYMSAAIAGERVCGRAYTAHTIIGGILATAVICIVVALSWVLVSFGKYTQEALSFLRYLIYFALTLIAVMLAVSSTGYHRAITNHGLTASDTGMIITSGAFILVGIALVILSHFRAALVEKWQNACVNVLAAGTLLNLAVTSISAGLVVSSDSKDWGHPSKGLIEASAWGALIPPLIVLLAAIGAIATMQKTPPVPAPAPPAESAAEGGQPINPPSA
ncbi:hypothetical protein [Actinomadura sp. NPDC000600]|uniref:hypothetical protein n=1 Tax=Actinomadura sp. NPDC000600 TaxID=3154262 RepID=UPI00339358F4